MTYDNVDEFISKIQNSQKTIKSGTLRFFGDWFGRPMDNCHEVTRIEFIENELVIEFCNNSLVSIIEPNGIILENDNFTLKNANKVRYEYGNSSSNTRLRKYYIEYIASKDFIIKSFGQIDKSLIYREKIKHGNPAFEIC